MVTRFGRRVREGDWKPCSLVCKLSLSPALFSEQCLTSSSSVHTSQLLLGRGEQSHTSTQAEGFTTLQHSDLFPTTEVARASKSKVQDFCIFCRLLDDTPTCTQTGTLSLSFSLSILRQFLSSTFQLLIHKIISHVLLSLFLISLH